jgi:mRNA-degrading endonuclease RelE of RelBE toxin-antitoxin system
MSYKAKSIPKFERELKRLAKKYVSLKAEYIELVQSLKERPEQGTALGNNCYKIRLSISSKGKGKRGGGRVITYVHVSQTTVYLLTIYDKAEKENISDGELESLLEEIPS